MQVVDPFIPVQKSHRSVGFRPQEARAVPSRQARSLDGVLPEANGLGRMVRRQPVHLQARTIRHDRNYNANRSFYSRPHAISQPTVPQVSRPMEQVIARQFNQSEAEAVHPSESGIKKIAAITGQVIILLALFGVGFLLRAAMIGQMLILLYGVFSLIRRIDSRTTFSLALISLIVVLVGSLRSDAALAATFAVYAFLFLVIGTVALGREIKV